MVSKAPAFRRTTLGLVTLAIAVSTVVSAASLGGRLSDVPDATPDAEAMRIHLSNARRLAGTDLTYWFNYRCITDQVNADFPAHSIMEPRKVYDNLYYLGSEAVSVWAVDTTEGIVLLDAGYNPKEAEDYIVHGLRKLGLDPARITHVIITHSHGDHFGGAQYLKDKFGAALYASVADWADMADQKRSGSRPELALLVPAHDRDIAEGQTITVGGNAFQFYVAGGHTPGSLAVLFRVYDRGKPHLATLFGGMGVPTKPSQLRDYAASLERFSDIARRAKADVMISNHQRQDQSMVKLDMLRWFPEERNPYTMGATTMWRYYRLHAECARVALARQGLSG
jgi:metallo-beta-lactamase class B